MFNAPLLTPQVTEDGSFTFFSPEFEECFHSRTGAKQEAEWKFVQPCQIRLKALSQKSLRILDVCYGLGYNSAAALTAIQEVNPDCVVEVVALEMDPTVVQAAIAQHLLDLWPPSVVAILEELGTAGHVTRPTFQGRMFWGDARLAIQQLKAEGFQADAIFLDPFSPPKCPQLWTVEFIDQLARCLAPTGRLATYSCAASVRTAFQLAGLSFGATVGVGRKSPGTVASFSPQDLPPLSLQEQEHLQTRAAIPYRDRALQDPAQTIRQRREQEQEQSSLEPTSRWKKRWSLGHASPPETIFSPDLP